MMKRKIDSRSEYEKYKIKSDIISEFNKLKKNMLESC